MLQFLKLTGKRYSLVMNQLNVFSVGMISPSIKRYQLSMPKVFSGTDKHIRILNGYMHIRVNIVRQFTCKVRKFVQIRGLLCH